MKPFARLGCAAAFVVLSAATAAADCPSSTYYCDNDISAELALCDTNPRTGWATVRGATGGKNFSDMQVTELPTSPNDPIKKFFGRPLLILLNTTVIQPTYDIKLAVETRDGPNFYATCKFRQ
jgi:hypothetical protein